MNNNHNGIFVMGQCQLEEVGRKHYSTSVFERGAWTACGKLSAATLSARNGVSSQAIDHRTRTRLGGQLGFPIGVK